MVLVAIFTFIDIWGEYLITLTMMDDPIRFTLAVGVANLNLDTARFTEAEIIPYGAQAAAYLLAAAPALRLRRPAALVRARAQED